jgi:hypothetical protein
MSAGRASNRVLAVLLTSGTAEAKIKMAIKHEAIGSYPAQPEKCTRMVDITTATEPRVSARIWRKIPCIFSFPCECEWP